MARVGHHAVALLLVASSLTSEASRLLSSAGISPGGPHRANGAARLDGSVLEVPAAILGQEMAKIVATDTYGGQYEFWVHIGVLEQVEYFQAPGGWVALEQAVQASLRLSCKVSHLLRLELLGEGAGFLGQAALHLDRSHMHQQVYMGARLRSHTHIRDGRRRAHRLASA